MKSVKQADCIGEKYFPLDGEGRPEYVRHKIFTNEEITPAETIITVLEGMTIESAEMILEKVKLYLKQISIPTMEN